MNETATLVDLADRHSSDLDVVLMWDRRPDRFWVLVTHRASGRTGPLRLCRTGRPMHLTLAQTMAYVAAISAGWLMVRAGVAKGQLKVKTQANCPSCGRKRSRNRCPCTEEH